MTNIQALPSPGTRYDEHTKRLAFEVYGYKAGRRVQETVRILAELGHDLSDKTIYEWRQSNAWDHKLDLDNAAKQEELIREHAGRLRVAAPEAVTYLDDVRSGKVPGDALRIKAAQVIVQENRALIIAVEKERDRERRQRGWSAPTGILADYHELDAMTDEELLEYQESLRSPSLTSA